MLQGVLFFIERCHYKRDNTCIIGIGMSSFVLYREVSFMGGSTVQGTVIGTYNKPPFNNVNGLVVTHYRSWQSELTVWKSVVAIPTASSGR